MASEAYDHHMRGKRYFKSESYAEARLCYEYALAVSDGYNNIESLKLDLALAWRMTGHPDEAAGMYRDVASSGGKYADLAQERLTHLEQYRHQQPAAPDAAPLTADDQRFIDIATPMLPDYPALARPVYITWVDESSQSLRWVQRFQQERGVAQEKCLQSLDGWAALCITWGHTHLILVKTDWKKAKDPALRGLLSHELTHAELKDTPIGRVVDPTQSRLHFICNERVTDLIAMSKGYGQDLLESRNFTERIKGPMEKNPEITTPRELSRILRRLR